MEERHLDVLREAMHAEEPALALEAIKGRIPFDGLVYTGDGVHADLVEPATHIALPARHGRDVGLNRGIAVGLCDLRIAAGEQFHFLGAGPGSWFLRVLY